MTAALGELLSAVPSPPAWRIDWTRIETSGLRSLIRTMEQTPQEAKYHGEGDVWTHTQMVCESLAAMPDFRALNERRRKIVFLAALLHDIGKTTHTRLEGGELISPGHAAAGARMARKLLWLDHGLCGTAEAQGFREAVCALIRYHSAPPWVMDDEDHERRLRGMASHGELLPDFSLRLLCLLGEADTLGRTAADKEDMADRVRLAAELAADAGCLDGPYPFPTPYTRFSYLSGRHVAPGVPLYDDTWGEVDMLAGLPGTGKDTWIQENCPDLPMVSLDDIRREHGIAPTADQARVAELAQERARELLRQKTPFVWNATDLSVDMRGKPLRLFHDYRASTRIVYLETGWEEELRRNAARNAAVPEERIARMLEKLSPPGPAEARKVEWRCV